MGMLSLKKQAATHLGPNSWIVKKAFDSIGKGDTQIILKKSLRCYIFSSCLFYNEVLVWFDGHTINHRLYREWCDAF